MIRLSVVFVLLLVSNFLFGQTERPFPEIQEMSWGNEFTVEMKLSNDSAHVYDVEELYHSASFSKNNRDELVYYPVGLEKSFIDQLKARKISNSDTTNVEAKSTNKTLWSAIHYSIGGAYVHFINCLLYALETGELRVDAPLMQRPESDWKPKPRTESWKRTRKWNYYVPVRQRYAIREYKKKARNDNLKDLQSVPQHFIDLFLDTRDKDYEELKEKGAVEKLAKIDLIKILLASNYLGETQIKYIKNRVLKAMSRYSVNQLPSVIILDDFNAAVAMSLNEKGYQVQKIVFRDQEQLSEYEMKERKKTIRALIHEINEVNKEVFQKSLKKYYQKG
ncbi:hypothetical protein L21SP5_03136 [Salinivirga cyanobacteriivorans]|uniref:Uncharacterized protein n=1 Tax=Salinivirga cyanobacteriivorans TaxID=1307839 RepID=A0A0S2I398_9BACT|nr:hypothetical protein [Salinivirga cyanobacteriivorans]ALO16751.1 hypothetical protein L21SP5_03136 [Salinivirga cyanobacteriivorans]